jgi:hypothetical protein
MKATSSLSHANTSTPLECTFSHTKKRRPLLALKCSGTCVINFVLRTTKVQAIACAIVRAIASTKTNYDVTKSRLPGRHSSLVPLFCQRWSQRAHLHDHRASLLSLTVSVSSSVYMCAYCSRAYLKPVPGISNPSMYRTMIAVL